MGLPNYIVTCNKSLDNGPGNPLTTRRYSEIPGNQKLPAHFCHPTVGNFDVFPELGLMVEDKYVDTMKYSLNVH